MCGIEAWLINFGGHSITVWAYHRCAKTQGKAHICHPCVLDRANKNSFDSSLESADHSSKPVQSSLCRKLPWSLHWYKYFYTFINQFSRYTHWVRIKEQGHTANVGEQRKDWVQLERILRVEYIALPSLVLGSTERSRCVYQQEKNPTHSYTTSFLNV